VPVRRAHPLLSRARSRCPSAPPTASQHSPPLQSSRQQSRHCRPRPPLQPRLAVSSSSLSVLHSRPAQHPALPQPGNSDHDNLATQTLSNASASPVPLLQAVAAGAEQEPSAATALASGLAVPASPSPSPASSLLTQPLPQSPCSNASCAAAALTATAAAPEPATAARPSCSTPSTVLLPQQCDELVSVALLSSLAPPCSPALHCSSSCCSRPTAIMTPNTSSMPLRRRRHRINSQQQQQQQQQQARRTTRLPARRPRHPRRLPLACRPSSATTLSHSPFPSRPLRSLLSHRAAAPSFRSRPTPMTVRQLHTSPMPRHRWRRRSSPQRPQQRVSRTTR
jgi:hypothetical protein